MLRPEIQKLLEPLIVVLGYELWGCDYLPQGQFSLLRIYIDKEGGISLEDCELVSKEVGALLDVEDPIQSNYSLEISSPGIPRPLFSKEHYSRYQGEQVMLKLRQPVNGSRKLAAKIVSVGKTSVGLEVGGTTINVEFSEILKANLIGEGQ
ncbi:MAG: ribosome maturation factor RimP [Legionellales bacterium RIFCSPHIGHO2_12_FULL_42_9]|nr:MAG: ribosome maturation factor RimP [Legionellales bacterium RIFCSPHIGHO2_12_FULL_42_9]